MPFAMLLFASAHGKPSPPSARGFALGLALAAQVFCSIYYGLFLAAIFTVAHGWC
jgi:hypothetical protein